MKKRQSDRAWRQKNRTRKRQTNHAWYERNRTEILARQHAKRDAQRQYISSSELEVCREDPRKAKTILGSDRIVCLECGQILKTLGPHIWSEHEMTAKEYKYRWGYNSGTGITSETFSKSAAKRARVHLILGPTRAGWLKQQRAGPIARAQEVRLAQPASLESRLDRGDKMRGKSQRHLWKRSSAGELITDAQIAQLRLKGMNYKEIWQRLGLNRTPVRLRLRRMGFPQSARPCLFVQGAPVTTQYCLDICSDFGRTKKQLARLIRTSYSTVVQSMPPSKPGKPVSVNMARKLLKIREKLTTQFQHQGATPQGGRPLRIPLSERVSMWAKYQELVHDLKILQKWDKQQGGRVQIDKVWDWLCERSRDQTLKSLLFWPEFLDSFTTDSCIDDPSPKVLAQEFLAESYDVSAETIRPVLRRGDPKYQAKARQNQLLLEASLTIVDGAEAMASKNLAKALTKSNPATWKDLTQTNLAAKLKLAGVKPRTIRLSGNKTPKGYYRKDLERALKNNLPLK